MSIEVTGPIHDRFDEILTPEALGFLADLNRRFDARRRELLARREERQRELSAGGLLGFLDETKDIREAEWRVAEPAPGLVEDRKSTRLNSSHSQISYAVFCLKKKKKKTPQTKT